MIRIDFGVPGAAPWRGAIHDDRNDRNDRKVLVELKHRHRVFELPLNAPLLLDLLERRGLKAEPRATVLDAIVRAFAWEPSLAEAAAEHGYELGADGGAAPEPDPAKPPEKLREEPPRSYPSPMPKRGPGKFDDDLAAAIYGVSLDGGSDDEVGSTSEAPGTWAGIMRDGPAIAEAIENDRSELYPGVTDEELRYLRTEGRAGVIVTEDDRGFVSVVYYDDPKKLEKDWEEAVEDLSIDDEEELESNASDEDDKDYLRDERIEPYIEGRGPVFDIQTWSTGRRDERGSQFLGYRITMTEPGKDPEVVFEGEDYSPSPMIDADSDMTLDDIVTFFVNDYNDESRTSRQREVVNEHGDTLSGVASIRFGEESEEREPNRRNRSNPQARWNIYLGRDHLDTVYFDSSMSAEEVKRSLIDHDNFDSRIRVEEMPRRMTGVPGIPAGRSANPSNAWDVYLRGKHIDTVFVDARDDADDVKRSLVNHDGYDPEIVVRRPRKKRGGSTPNARRRRKTIYRLQGTADHYSDRDRAFASGTTHGRTISTTFDTEVQALDAAEAWMRRQDPIGRDARVWVEESAPSGSFRVIANWTSDPETKRWRPA